MNNLNQNSRPWSMHPLVQIVLMRMREFLREPEAVFWVCVFPVLMTVALGLAFRNPKQEEFHIDVAGDDAATTAVIGILEKQPQLHVEHLTATEAKQRLLAGRSDLLVMTKPDAKAENSSSVVADSATSPSYYYHFDISRAGSLQTRSVVDQVLQVAAGRQDRATVRDVEIDARYIDFLVPGLLGMSLMGGGLWGVGFVTVDMRIRKLLKRFVATPMRKSQFLGGIMIGRLLFLIPEVVILLICSYLLFDVRSHGSWLELFALVLLGAFTFSGIGLLVASRAKTIEMVSGLMNLIMVPMWIFSGIFFNPDKFPDVMQPFIKILPLTALNKLLRNVMQQGDTIFHHPWELGLLLVMGIVSFLLALRLFRWS